MVRLTKRQVVRLVSFGAALLLLVSCACFAGFSVANRYRNTIEQGYQLALSELSDYMTSIKSSLEKGIYANTSTGRLSLAAKLCSDSAGAKSALSRLPVTSSEGEKLHKFLSQVGDYSRSIINASSRGYEFSSQNRDTLVSLSSYADKLSPILEELSAKYSDGETQLGVKQTIQGNLTEEPPQKFTLDYDFGEINNSFASYPTLIYDGPFADSTQNRESVFLGNYNEISEHQATEKAAKFLSTTADALTMLEPTQGKIPSYVLSTGDNEYITVSKQGGFIVEMTKSDSPNGKSLEYKDAIKKAAEFLNKNGFKNMQESYYVINNNICIINFAYMQDEAVCYGDLIKVGVSMQNGEIVSYNAENYLMNHCIRNTEPYLPLSSARRSLSPYLTEKNSRLAVVPIHGDIEYLCYEFLCKGVDGEDILVYINCETGLEEQILILLKSDNGVLTI
ncbi:MULTISPECIES: PepSY1/2 domain-containing protein [unclassified Ruminococcus]|uniref:PepSY1/2 domain-containing protein n=1 Tax=unclassified Ruminococcus TaxID=2608920 RepID=UPI00210E6578|nr:MULTISPECIES: PepSY1/2 domain-containing protein [unclassified Ruminococcus]MCQ4022200.1 hypothetical protein [Ruminococcus sp. zg-924]MCQ4115237.1 hypothetical protein [Ruminococcus sp. zg-921]